MGDKTPTKSNMTASVAVERISELVDTLKSGRSEPKSQHTRHADPKPTATEQFNTENNPDSADSADSAKDSAAPELVIQETVLPSATDAIELPIAKATKVEQATTQTATTTTSAQPLEAGKQPKKTRQNRKATTSKNGSNRRRKTTKGSRANRAELQDRMEVLMDNQMRITQALALKIPAVVRCSQPLPNHRWPGRMRVNRPDTRDMPEGSFTWYDGFNVYSTESDATSKQFSDDKLRRTQVTNAKYPENKDDDDDGDDSKTFVHKRAWP